MTLHREHPDDLATLAGLVVDELEARGLVVAASTLPKLIDAAAVAEMLGVDRETVYRLKDELGAFRIGSGEKAPLRFDPAKVLAACSVSRSSERPDPLPPRRPRRRQSVPDRRESPLLPIKGVK